MTVLKTLANSSLLAELWSDLFVLANRTYVTLKKARRMLAVKKSA